MKESLGVGLRRFVVEQLRDTRSSIKGRPVTATLARPQLNERLKVWWVDLGVPAKVEVLEARLRAIRPLGWRR